jgi:hypothetical protein
MEYRGGKIVVLEWNPFFLGETVVSLQKAALIPGGSDSLVYTTLSGEQALSPTSHHISPLSAYFSRLLIKHS